MAHSSPDQHLRGQRNTARFFVEHPSIAWMLLIGTVVWGVFGYLKMPKRKDPEISIPIAAVVCAWPGVPADRIEQQVTQRLEARIAENANIERIESTVRTSVSVTQIKLREVKDLDKELADLQGKLSTVDGLPEGAGPVVFMKDFRDTASLMVTVATPEVDDVEIAVRAQSVRNAITEAREGVSDASPRVSLVLSFPATIPSAALRPVAVDLGNGLSETGQATRVVVFERSGFVGVDLSTPLDDAALRSRVDRICAERARQSDTHPDLWAVALIRDPNDAESALRSVAGPRYSYQALDGFTETIKTALLASPRVAKVTRTGVLDEAIYLGYSQQKLASVGISPATVRSALSARNVEIPGGILEAGNRNVVLVPTGRLTSDRAIGEVMVGSSPRGGPLYVRDLFEVARAYRSPPRFLNSFSHFDTKGQWHSGHAITLAVMMRSGDQIAEFGDEVDRVLQSTRSLLPPDLILAKTSDQPLQVRESVDLFMRSLWEAVILVVLVAFVGFWEWRSALLIALSIPLTLAMTFGMMHALHVDLQQISIASLILALGLLVDDPVVAGDAIQREVGAGLPSRLAAWIGPTKLANAIVFATLTNIAAYLPFLTLSGATGDFIHSLPVVLTCSLVASRIVSMTFVPLLGSYLFRRKLLSAAPTDSRKRLWPDTADCLVGRSIIEGR